MRRIFISLIGCILILAQLSVVAFAEEGQFRIGVVAEAANMNLPIGSGLEAHGNDLGFLFGYEKQVSDSLWYGFDVKALHGSRTSRLMHPWRNSEARAVARIGTLFHYDIDIKPFVGVGVNYRDQDSRSRNNFYYTDYILPVGVSFEKNTDYGLIGSDIQYEYVVHHEFYSTCAGDAGRTKSFGGNGNFEVGLFFEPKDIPIGFRPYYRYEHAYKGLGHGWEGPYDRNIGGLELYYRF